MTLWWVRGTFFCAGVITNEKGIIVETAPILKAFLGQRIKNITAWSAVQAVKKVS